MTNKFLFSPFTGLPPTTTGTIIKVATVAVQTVRLHLALPGLI